MEFGVFDHLDRGQNDLTAQFEDRLRLTEAYDEAGFYAYHLAEHHATPLGMAPSPGIFLSTVAQRTRRLRFGPTVYCLPLYHPIRLLEEICMLDQMSGGRLELGVGRGISPIEVGYFGLNTETAPAMYREGLELILAGFAAGRDGGDLNFIGEHYQVSGMPVTLAPRQQPHPPLWYGLSLPDSTVWAAQNAVNIITNRDEAGSRQITDRYRQEWRNLGHDDGSLPRMGMTRHVVNAETGAEALGIARRAYKIWRTSFYLLWDRHGMKPINVNFPDTVEELAALGQAIIGTPDHVGAEIERQVEASGINYFLCRFAFGDITYDEAKQSVDLFARHIAPKQVGG
ncbi:MAG: LLM class flavin-dependent oxidoreductase [Alphaproteobacteria bacterium]|nr:LLM class flavin-dependent oxidoreductase [Alphaproteobacteria bacterium]